MTKKLNEYGKTDEDKIEIISQAINGKWKDFYELKKEEKKEGVIYETIWFRIKYNWLHIL